jgi:hypothetical protein
MKSLTHKNQHYQVIGEPFSRVFLLEKISSDSIVSRDLPRFIYATPLKPLSKTELLTKADGAWIIESQKLKHVTDERQAIESYKRQKEVLMLADMTIEYTFELAEIDLVQIVNSPSTKFVALSSANPNSLMGLSKAKVMALAKQTANANRYSMCPPLTYYGHFENDSLVEVVGKHDMPTLKVSIVANQILVRFAPKYAEALVLYSSTSTTEEFMQANLRLSQGICAIAYRYKSIISAPIRFGSYNEHCHFIPNFDGSYQQHNNFDLMPFHKNTPLDLRSSGFTIHSQGII